MSDKNITEGEWHSGWPKDQHLPKSERYYDCLVDGECEMRLMHFYCEMKMTHEWVMPDGGYLRGADVKWKKISTKCG